MRGWPFVRGLNRTPLPARRQMELGASSGRHLLLTTRQVALLQRQPQTRKGREGSEAAFPPFEPCTPEVTNYSLAVPHNSSSAIPLPPFLKANRAENGSPYLAVPQALRLSLIPPSRIPPRAATADLEPKTKSRPADGNCAKLE